MNHTHKENLIEKVTAEMKRCSIERAFTHQIRSGEWTIRAISDEPGPREIRQMMTSLSALYGRVFLVDLSNEFETT